MKKNLNSRSPRVSAAGATVPLSLAQQEEERSRFQFIANASRDLISFVDLNYVYRAVNSAYRRIYGGPNREIVGTSVPDAWGSKKFESVIKPRFMECFAGKEVHDQEWIDCGSRGRRFMDITYHPYRGKDGRVQGAGVTSHDVTELKLAEEAVRQSEARYRTLVETSPDWIVSADADGDYTFLNAHAKTALKEKKNYLVFVHKDDLERTKARWDALLRGGEIRDFENRIVDRDGRVHSIAWNASPLRDSAGIVTGAIAIGRDMGPKRKLEQMASEAGLTARETEVFHLVIQGDSNLNIAGKLGIRQSTVKAHLFAIFRKLGVSSRTQLGALVR